MGDRGEDPGRGDGCGEGEQYHRSLVEIHHTVSGNHPEMNIITEIIICTLYKMNTT